MLPRTLCAALLLLLMSIGARSEEAPAPESPLSGEATLADEPFAEPEAAQPEAAEPPVEEPPVAEPDVAVARSEDRRPTHETVVVEADIDSQTEKIYQELERPTTLDFVDTPLAEAVQYLEDFHKIQIEMDKKALEDAGLATDAPITRQLQNISLRSALRLIFDQLDLDYIIRDQVLMITTKDAADNYLVVKVYPVEDLVVHSGKMNNNALLNVIESAVRPASWDASGGQGSITPFRGSLVISQTETAHYEVAQLLRQLRQPAVAAARQATPFEEQTNPPGVKQKGQQPQSNPQPASTQAPTESEVGRIR